MLCFGDKKRAKSGFPWAGLYGLRAVCCWWRLERKETTFRGFFFVVRVVGRRFESSEARCLNRRAELVGGCESSFGSEVKIRNEEILLLLTGADSEGTVWQPGGRPNIVGLDSFSISFVSGLSLLGLHSV